MANPELEQLIGEWNTTNRVYNLRDLARSVVGSSSIDRLEISTQLEEVLIRYGKLKVSNCDNIYYSHPIETINIYMLAAEKVLKHNRPTVWPEASVNRSIQYDDQTEALVYQMKLSPKDREIFTWWIRASHQFDGCNLTTQFQTLRTLLSLMYDITLKNTPRSVYVLGRPAQDLYGEHGSMGVSFRIEGDDMDMDDGEGLREYMANFMLVSAFADMIGKPEKHVFSTDCRCWVCIMSPEYMNILNTPEPVPSNIDGHLVFVITKYVKEIIPRLLLTSKDIVNYKPLFLAGRGAVRISQKDYEDLIEWTTNYIPSSGGVMFVGKDRNEADGFIKFFIDVLKSVKVIKWSEYYKEYRDKSVFVIDCITENIPMPITKYYSGDIEDDDDIEIIDEDEDEYDDEDEDEDEDYDDDDDIEIIEYEDDDD